MTNRSSAEWTLHMLSITYFCLHCLRHT